jgi:branched-chain amino acid transport system ATP-binding protein
MLELHGLAKRFAGIVASSHVDLVVRKNTLHALIGPNGAGKTTLIAQIAGTLAPDAGSILLAGKDITHLPCHARIGLGLARTFQTSNLFAGSSVLENIAFALQARAGRFYGILRARDTDGSLRNASHDLARSVGLENELDTLARELSHGGKRLLEIALALAAKPEVLLLDEPTAGLGSEESQRMVELIARLKSHHTILLVEHDMDAVFRLADRIAVLVSGRIIANGMPEEIRVDAAVRTAYLGDSHLVEALQ